MSPRDLNNKLMQKFCIFNLVNKLFTKLANNLLANYMFLIIKQIPLSYVFQITNRKTSYFRKFIT